MNIEKLLSTIQELKDRKETNEAINHTISENLKSFYNNDMVDKINSNINFNIKKEILNNEHKNLALENKISKSIFFSIPIVMFYVFFSTFLVIFNIIELKNYLLITIIPVIVWFLSSISSSIFSLLFIKKSRLKVENKKDLFINNIYEKEIKKITVDIIEDISNDNINQNDSVLYLKNYLLKNLREYENNQTTPDNFFFELKKNIKKEIFNKNDVLETKKINNIMHESTELDNYYSTLVNSIQKDKV